MLADLAMDWREQLEAVERQGIDGYRGLWGGDRSLIQANDEKTSCRFASRTRRMTSPRTSQREPREGCGPFIPASCLSGVERIEHIHQPKCFLALTIAVAEFS